MAAAATVLVAMLAMALATAQPASATDGGADADYVLAVWEATKAYPDHFDDPQSLVTFTYTDSTSLDQLDSVFECGKHYQVDL